MSRIILTMLVMVCVALSASNNLLGADLIALWTFDQDSGDEVKDVVGGHDGEIIDGDADWVAGKFGNGLKIQGGGHHVEVEKADDLELPQVTIIAWVNLDTTAGRQEIASYADSYGLFAEGGVFKVFIFNGGAWNTAPGVTPVAQGEWYQVAGVVDESEIMLYLNGKLDVKLAIPAIAYQNFPMWFGGGPADNQFWLTGIIDEIEIWNDVLSEDEIGELYRTPPSLGAVDQADKITNTWGNIKK